jgi:RNA polymerase sigma-70 factor, ECF subfamily
MGVDAQRRSRFELLFAEHHMVVRSYVQRRSAGVMVDDVVADTFLVLWRRLDEAPEEVRPWLLGVTRRVLADHRRTTSRQRSLAERLTREPARPAVSPLPDGLSEELAGALRGLTEQEREALLLVAWDGLSPREAAVVVGCPSGAFRARLHRARQHVARQVGIDEAVPNLTERPR